MIAKASWLLILSMLVTLPANGERRNVLLIIADDQATRDPWLPGQAAAFGH